ncbi:DUF3558 family protein [Saccharopolyspora pogona]|uniref:DUF3558 family protein n=1 Tax=Saccharopolyspora pogona TaxID=333966 RepID=UPI001CC23DCC|nr:DUF3558 family protein [Saccharopolyspora pogona]
MADTHLSGDLGAAVGFGGAGAALSAIRQENDQLAQQISVRFDRTEVDGRPAVVTVDKGSVQARICSARFDAGEGSIIITLREETDQGLDECAEAVKIAEVVAPRMPR